MLYLLGVLLAVIGIALSIALHHTAERSAFGKRLIESLARQLNASIAWQPGDPGTSIDIRLPRESPGAKDST